MIWLLLGIQILLLCFQGYCISNEDLDDKLGGFSMWGCIPNLMIAMFSQTL